MLRPEYCLPHFHHLHMQLFRLRPSSLIPVGRCQVGDAGQGVWMHRPEYSLPRLQHLHFQLIRLRSSSLILVGTCQVGDAHQGVWMLGPEYSPPCLHHLHFQLFLLGPSSLIPVVNYAHQSEGMLKPEYPLPRSCGLQFAFQGDSKDVGKLCEGEAASLNSEICLAQLYDVLD